MDSHPATDRDCGSPHIVGFSFFTTNHTYCYCLISARGQYPKNYCGKNFRQKEKPTECPRFDPLFGSNNNYLDVCSVTSIVQHSVFVEFSRMNASRMNASRRKEGKGYESGNPPAGVFLLREERYSSVICLIRKRRLLDRGARVRLLCPFPTAHPAGVFFRREERYNHVICLIRRCLLFAHGARVLSLRRFPPAHPEMCAMFHHACFAMMCVTHKTLVFWRHQYFCIFCVYDLHQPLSYGC